MPRFAARAASLAFAVFATATAALAAPVAIETAPLPLNVDQPSQSEIGALRFIGAIRIGSSDRIFGSYSGMVLEADGKRLTAVSDEGHWITLTLTFDDTGRLSGAQDADIVPMLDLAGQPISRKSLTDAEGLRRDRDGTLLVSFEREHRIWRYRDTNAKAEEIPQPRGFGELKGNDGLESLALLADGRLLAIEEGPDDGAEFVRAWAGRGDNWRDMRYRRHGRFRPTDAVALPESAPWNGDVLVLERRFTLVGGVAARLVRVSASKLNSGDEIAGSEIAEFVPPVTVDNMEGIDVVAKPDGSLQVFILSDDNQNPLQRTILMQFELRR